MDSRTFGGRRRLHRGRSAPTAQGARCAPPAIPAFVVSDPDPLARPAIPTRAPPPAAIPVRAPAARRVPSARYTHTHTPTHLSAPAVSLARRSPVTVNVHLGLPTPRSAPRRAHPRIRASPHFHWHALTACPAQPIHGAEPACSTQYPIPNTQYPVPNAQHPIPSARAWCRAAPRPRWQPARSAPHPCILALYTRPIYGSALPRVCASAVLPF